MTREQFDALCTATLEHAGEVRAGGLNKQHWVARCSCGQIKVLDTYNGARAYIGAHVAQPKPVMSVESLALATRYVSEKYGDPEEFHAAEDQLYVAVLRHIAASDRDSEARHLARTVLPLYDVEIQRWYA